MIKASNKSSPIITDDEKAEADVWALPGVENETLADDTSTNVFGHKPQWKYEPPEEEVEEPAPLTVEDIEEIRQAAYQEGFNQGKEEGFSQGYEEGKPQGHQEGYEAGFKEGEEKGIESGKTQVDENAQAFEALMQQLHQPLAKVDKNVEAQLLQLVVELTQAVTLHEAKTNPDIILSAVSEGINALPSQAGQIQILLNPSDIKRITEHFGEDHLKQQAWHLLAAPQFDQGSCQIENSISNIDLQMKSRLKEVLDSFLQQALHQ